MTSSILFKGPMSKEKLFRSSKSRSRPRSRSRSRSKEVEIPRKVNGSNELKASSSYRKIKKICLDNKNKDCMKRFVDPRLEILEEKRRKIYYDMNNKNRLNLVLDLDETLLSMCDKGTQKLIITRNELQDTLHVEYRPHLFEFLKEVGKYFDIFLYSHGEKNYVGSAKNLIELSSGIELRPEFYAMEPEEFRKNASKAKKNLSKLLIKKSDNSLYTAEELLDRTIIIDDTFKVWDDNHGSNIIVSKKFFPYEGTKEETEKLKQDFVLFSKLTSISKMEISFTESMKTDFVERNNKRGEEGQLFYLKHFLVKLAKLYYLKRNLSNILSGPITELLNSERKNILNGKNILIYEESLEHVATNRNFKSIGTLIRLMGGNSLWDKSLLRDRKKKIDFVLINVQDLNSKSDDSSRIVSRRLAELNPYKENVKIVSELWVLNSYFCCVALPINEYLLNNII